jgi:hypothetical protein
MANESMKWYTERLRLVANFLRQNKISALDGWDAFLITLRNFYNFNPETVGMMPELTDAEDITIMGLDAKICFGYLFAVEMHTKYLKQIYDK